MRDSTVNVATTQGRMPVYDVRPDGDARAAVIVIQEAFGVNEHIEDVTRRFAAVGYHAVAPHLFHRTGGGTIPYDRFDLVGPHFAGMSDDGITADLEATLEHVTGAGFSLDRTGIVGFCMGGRVSFLAACRMTLGAAVGFYGGGILKGRSEALGPLAGEIGKMATPWLGLFGDEDQSIPIEEVEELKRLLEAEAPVATEVVRYPDAGHGFHCDRRDSFDEPSAHDAWERTLEWFDRFLA